MVMMKKKQVLTTKAAKIVRGLVHNIVNEFHPWSDIYCLGNEWRILTIVKEEVAHQLILKNEKR